MLWYLPSLYGDIRLEALEKERTKLTIFGLSPQEKVAMRALILEAEKERVLHGPWLPGMSRHLDLDSTKQQSVELTTRISKIQKILTRHLKPKREQVTVVKFESGKMVEMTEQLLQEIEVAPASLPSSKAEQKKKLRPVAATVAEPYRGCPAPDFEQAEVRAQDVMRAFLTPEQIEDFETDGSFISIGADTGHRYAITSRYARGGLAKYTRSLYDLDEHMAYCVHDWEVPAAEELLAIHLLLSVPGREMFLRGIRHVDDVRLT